MRGPGNQKGHVSNYSCNDCFLPDHLLLFKFISINTVAPGSIETYLAFSMFIWDVVLPSSTHLHFH